MTMFKIRRIVAATGLALVAGGALGAGIASAGGNTAAPKPPQVCAVAEQGMAPKEVPCPTNLTIGEDGKVRDASGAVVGEATAVGQTSPR